MNEQHFSKRKRQTLTVELKQHTQAVHERLHKHPNLAKMTLPELSKEDYIWFLTKQFGFYEACFTEYPKNPFSHLTSPSQEWLKFDLAQLKVDTGTLSFCKEIPALLCRAHWLGFLYVKEGALLGGRVMFKNIKSNHPELSAASRYLTGWAEQSSAKWQSTVGAINTLLAGEELAIARSSALNTFLCFEKWLSD